MTALPRTDPTIVNVALGSRTYDIVIGRGQIASLGARAAALKPGARAAIVTDDVVARLHLEAAETAIHSTRAATLPGLIHSRRAGPRLGYRRAG